MADLLALAEAFLARATRAGAEHAEVLAARTTDLTCNIRKSVPETLERSETTALGLRVFIGNASASVSSSDLSPDNLQQLADTAVAIAKAAPPDPFARLADKDRLAKKLPDLDLFDASEPTLEELQAICRETESIGTGHKGITNSEGADAGYGAHESILVTSHGYSGRYRSSSFGLSLSLIAGTGADMQRDYAYSSARHHADLKSAHAIGTEAAERTLQRMNPEKPHSGRLPLVFDPRVARSLLSSFASAINGASVARGTSFLKSDMGKKLFDSSIRIIDDPLRKRGLASRPADAEGVATQPLTLIENGELKSWILDTRSAAQLDLSTTGHAVRSLGSAPSPSSSNLHLAAGTITPAALIENITDGILITETFGMGINLTTGDYSQGASGLRIVKGQLAGPVSELTIAGNLRDMFTGLIPANDLTFEFATNSPTLRIDSMMVAGA